VGQLGKGGRLSMAYPNPPMQAQWQPPQPQEQDSRPPPSLTGCRKQPANPVIEMSKLASKRLPYGHNPIWIGLSSDHKVWNHRRIIRRGIIRIEAGLTIALRRVPAAAKTAQMAPNQICLTTDQNRLGSSKHSPAATGLISCGSPLGLTGGHFENFHCRLRGQQAAKMFDGICHDCCPPPSRFGGLQ